MVLFDLFSGDIGNDVHQLVDRHHFFGTDVDRPLEIGSGQPQSPFDAFIHIEERTRLQAIAPNLDGIARGGIGNLAADSRRRLFLAAVPGAFRPKDVVKPRNPVLQAIIAIVGEEQSLGEQLFPTIFAVRRGGIGRRFGAVGVVGIFLIVGRIHARG